MTTYKKKVLGVINCIVGLDDNDMMELIAIEDEDNEGRYISAVQAGRVAIKEACDALKIDIISDSKGV